MLNAEFIDNLPETDEEIIVRYQNQILKEIACEAECYGKMTAWRRANRRYGNNWKERLELKKIYRDKDIYVTAEYHDEIAYVIEY